MAATQLSQTYSGLHFYLKKGGYWVDTDFVCLKPMYFDQKYAIASEPNENYNEQLVNILFT